MYKKFWVLGTHARGKRQRERKIGVPHWLRKRYIIQFAIEEI
jgi:hypothetical protein